MDNTNPQPLESNSSSQNLQSNAASRIQTRLDTETERKQKTELIVNQVVKIDDPKPDTAEFLVSAQISERNINMSLKMLGSGQTPQTPKDNDEQRETKYNNQQSYNPIQSNQQFLNTQQALSGPQLISRKKVHTSNDLNSVQQKLQQLQDELAALDDEHSHLIDEQTLIRKQTEEIKQHNKMLFANVAATQEQKLLYSDSISNEPSQNLTSNQSIQPGNEESGGQLAEIHSLYQDLFLTDIRREVESAQTELKECKIEQNTASIELQKLKRDNINLQATLKRYRKTLQGLTQHNQSPSKKKERRFQESAMSNDHSPDKKSLKRPESGTSIMSSLTNPLGGANTSVAATSVHNQLDRDRIDKLLNLFQSLSKITNQLDLIKCVLNEIKGLIQFANCTMFLIAPTLIRQVESIKPDIDQVYIARSILDNGRSQIGASKTEPVALAIYKNFDEVRYGIKTLTLMAQPVLFRDDEIFLVIQCEAKMNKKTNKTYGFHASDEQVLKIICQYMAMQIEKVAAKKEVNKKEQAIIDTLQLTSEVCTQRHFQGLFSKMREFMPKYFGFQGCGVLLFNKETNWMFTDPEFNMQAEEEEEKDKKSKTKKAQSDEEEDYEHGLTDNVILGGKDKQNVGKPAILTPKEKLDQLRKIYNKQFINFPNNTGISGIVFSSKKVYYSNSADKETNFVTEVDNQSSTTDTKNFMIGPVFGKDRDLPNGIIQFINKTNEQGAVCDITEEDRQKFEEMADLIGMCIDNTQQISTTIGITLQINDKMSNISNIMEIEEKNKNQNPTLDMLDQIQTGIQVIKDQYKQFQVVSDREKPNLPTMDQVDSWT